MRELPITSVPTGTGSLADRLLVAAHLARGLAGFLVIGLAGFLVIGLAGFLVIAKRMIEAGFFPQVDIGVAAGAAPARSHELTANLYVRTTDEVAHRGPAAVLCELIVA